MAKIFYTGVVPWGHGALSYHESQNIGEGEILGKKTVFKGLLVLTDRPKD